MRCFRREHINKRRRTLVNGPLCTPNLKKLGMPPSFAVAGAGPARLLVALLLSRQGLSVDGASQRRVNCSLSACL
jgi:hypothetical protein